MFIPRALLPYLLAHLRRHLLQVLLPLIGPQVIDLYHGKVINLKITPSFFFKRHCRPSDGLRPTLYSSPAFVTLFSTFFSSVNNWRLVVDFSPGFLRCTAGARSNPGRWNVYRGVPIDLLIDFTQMAGWLTISLLHYESLSAGNSFRHRQSFPWQQSAGRRQQHAGVISGISMFEHCLFGHVSGG